ncbi:hypothetical protein TNCV_4817651 [Trichonephila clavipes]|nr:hypothetical protein TNCV_4817651 [Trichonephila clavipes]
MSPAEKCQGAEAFNSTIKMGSLSFDLAFVSWATLRTLKPAQSGLRVSRQCRLRWEGYLLRSSGADLYWVNGVELSVPFSEESRDLSVLVCGRGEGSSRALPTDSLDLDFGHFLVTSCIIRL